MDFSPLLSLQSIFIMNGYWMLSQLHLFNDQMPFFRYSIELVNCTHWFLDVRPILYSWDKLHLFMMCCYSFYIARFNLLKLKKMSASMFFFIFLIFSLERAQAGEGRREGDRGSEAGSALTGWQQWAWCGAGTHELWDDLSQSWTLNWLSHPGAPCIYVLEGYWSLVLFPCEVFISLGVRVS